MHSGAFVGSGLCAVALSGFRFSTFGAQGGKTVLLPHASDKLYRIADKELAAEPKIALLEEVKSVEVRCVDAMGKVISDLSAQ